MSTSTAKALDSQHVVSTTFAGFPILVTQEIEAGTGRDLILVTTPENMSVAEGEKLFAAATKWTNRLAENYSRTGATCVRVNDETQIATVVGQAFPEAAVNWLATSLAASAPTPFPEGDEADAIGKDDDDESDDDPKELHV